MAVVAAAIASMAGAFISGTMWTVAWIATAMQIGLFAYQQSQFNTSSDSPTNSFGPIQNTKTQKLPVPVIYGELLVAGNVFYEKFKNDKCEEVDRMFGISCGPIESISEVKCGDNLITEVSGCTLNIHLNSDSTTTDPLDPDGVRAYPNGIAFISTHLKAGDDISGSDAVTSIVKGRKVWTPGGTKWSDNPAWCILDLLTNTVYGCGTPLEKIDFDSFEEAADYYDGLVDGHRRFTLNYIADTQRPAVDILKEMLTVCFSYIVEREKVMLIADKPVASASASITTKDIVEGTFMWKQKSNNEIYNRIVIEWKDPANAYEQVVTIYEDENDQSERGIYENSVSMLGCTSVHQANRAGARILDSSLFVRNFCTFETSISSIECGDVIELTHDIPGWNEKLMRVLAVTDIDNKDDRVRVACAEYIPEIYDDEPLNVPVHIDTGIHGVYIPDNVTNIEIAEQLEVQSDGTYIDWCVVTWNNPNQNYSHLEMWYRFDSQANYIAGGNIPKSAAEYRIDATGHSRIYVKVVVVGSMGKRSSGTTATHTITGDTTPPAAPTNLSAVGGYKIANVAWTDPSDADLDHVDVYRSTNDQQYLFVGRSFRGEQAFLDRNLGILTVYWYKLKAVDTAGNESVFSATTQCQTEAIPQAEIPDYSIEGKKLVSDVFGDTDKNAEAVIREMLTDYERDKQTGAEIVLRDNRLQGEIGQTQAELAEKTVILENAVEDISSLTGRVGNTEAEITEQRTILDGAVEDISEISADLGETNVQVEHNVIALNSDTAQANQVAEASINDSLTLYNKDKQNTVTISETKEILDDVTGRWAVRIDNNKRVSGIALLNGEDESNFTVLADKFLVTGNGANDEVIPVFEVDTTTGKSYLKGDLIAEGTITGNMINARTRMQLADGGELLLGEGSIIQMASGAVVIDASQGTIRVSDPENLTTGDYALLERGDLTTYKYIAGRYYAQKSLRQMDIGVATNGTITTLSGVWASKPKIIVSPNILQCYKASSSSADQQLKCYADEISNPDANGIVTFIPKAILQISSGNVIVNNPVSPSSVYTYDTSPSFNIANICTIPSGCQNIRVTVKYYGQKCVDAVSYHNKYKGLTCTISLKLGSSATYSAGSISTPPIKRNMSSEPSSIYHTLTYTIPSGSGVLSLIGALSVYGSESDLGNFYASQSSYAWLRVASVQYETAATTQLATGTLNYMAIAE